MEFDGDDGDVDTDNKRAKAITEIVNLDLDMKLPYIGK